MRGRHNETLVAVGMEVDVDTVHDVGFGLNTDPATDFDWQSID